MYLFPVTPADGAEGVVNDVYTFFLSRMGLIPRPIEMLSLSPELLERQFSYIQYYSGHPTLSMPLLAAIRYVVARKVGYQCCIDLNGNVLNKCGMEQSDLEALYGGKTGTPLEEREEALVAFVAEKVANPESTSQETLDALKAMGWTDKDIFEATYHGFSLVGPAMMEKVFTS